MRVFRTRTGASRLRRSWSGGLCLAAVLGGCGTGPAASAQQSTKVNPHALQIEKFHQGVTAYGRLHEKSAAQLTPLKPKESRAKTLEFERALAAKIRAARPHAKQGDLFTPSVAREFRRAIRLFLPGRGAAPLRASPGRGEPGRLRGIVNGSYPSSVSLQKTPPPPLLHLPQTTRQLG